MGKGVEEKTGVDITPTLYMGKAAKTSHVLIDRHYANSTLPNELSVKKEKVKERYLVVQVSKKKNENVCVEIVVTRLTIPDSAISCDNFRKKIRPLSEIIEYKKRHNIHNIKCI